MNATIGLCVACKHARIIENRRGSRFWLCSRSRTDPRFSRYPRLPVLHCIGYELGEPLASADAEPDQRGE